MSANDTMLNLLIQAYQEFHHLHHAHGCVPGALLWSTTGDQPRPRAAYGDKLIEHIAEAIKAETGSYPKPCHLCRPDLMWPRRIICVMRTNPDGTCDGCDGSGYVLVDRWPACRVDGCENQTSAIGGVCDDHSPSLALNIEE